MKALRKYLLAALALCAGAGIVLFPGELSEAGRGRGGVNSGVVSTVPSISPVSKIIVAGSAGSSL